MMPVDEWRLIPSRTCVISATSTWAITSLVPLRCNCRTRSINTTMVPAYGCAKAKAASEAELRMLGASWDRRTCMAPTSAGHESSSCQAILRTMLANIAEANGRTPISMYGSVSIQTFTVAFCGAALCPAKRLAPAIANMATKRVVFIYVSPPPLRAEVDGKTGHGRDIFFLGIAMLPRSAEVTGLLRAWSGGDQTALDRLAGLVYDELHRMARHYMQDERTGNTLQTTALVNEVYLRLVDVRNVDWQQRPSLGCPEAFAGGNLKMSQPCPASTERNSSTSRKNARSASGSLL